MNISAISTAAPKFQTAKTSSNAARNLNFTGLEKAAQTAGEAAASAASKAGITDKVVKVLHIVLEGLKNLGQMILRGIKKIFHPHDINIGKNNSANYTVNGKNVSAEEFSEAIEGVADDIINIGQATDKKGGHSVIRIFGKTFINGKLYKPGDKLPNGFTLKDNVLNIEY